MLSCRVSFRLAYTLSLHGTCIFSCNENLIDSSFGDIHYIRIQLRYKRKHINKKGKEAKHLQTQRGGILKRNNDIYTTTTKPSSLLSVFAHIPQGHIPSLFLVSLACRPRILDPLQRRAKHALIFNVLVLYILLANIRARVQKTDLHPARAMP
jgi:hypothetical protein